MHQIQNFQRISPFGIAPAKKKHIRIGHADIMDYSVHLSNINTRFLKSIKKKRKKGMDRTNKKSLFFQAHNCGAFI